MTKLVPTSENARRTMRANQAVSGREVAFRKALWAAGARGYRVNATLPGRPDIVFPALRLAIFVNGCFWHLCPACNPLRPRGNADFWKNKLEANRARDARVQSQLEALGWEVEVVWEHEIRPDPRPRAKQLADQLLRSAGPITRGGQGRTDVDLSSPPSTSAARGPKM
ncbi:MAG: very short patch repair endonuclease [Candidatus Limnocylindrales bacterium]